MVLVVGAVACLAVALLRDELFDVELVLNRALVYGLLSIVVVACYILVVGYLSLLFQGSGNLWVSLVATGVVAALFQPLRARVQRLVNQLLYGQRAEPYAVVAELGRRLATSLAPDAVLPAIVATVAGALRLPYAAIALHQGDDEVTATAYGEAPMGISLATFPLIYQGPEVGQLRVAPRAGESELSADDRRLLEDLAHQAGVAAHAVQLTNDLRRSREQLVSAREEERRRLRRDLHDGLGPALASQALTVDTVELLLSRDPAAAAALLREVKAQSQAAITEIRRVIYGLRPPALDDLGLVGALREQANRLVLSRTEIRIEAPEPLLPLPAAVEVAAYHIAQEALANVARHASARHCTVVLAVSDVLTLTVTDDGMGIPAARTAGIGLSSMRERAAELGGTLALETAMGRGTSVRATLPLGG
jgi:signal transduction histidine kinase